MKRLLAVDWGTSSLRGALLDKHGEALEERSFARGILTVAPGGFPQVFRDCFGDWMTQGTLCLMSGMVGSRQGWREAPYCPCPAGLEAIAARLEWLDWLEAGRIAIVPGLCIETSGAPDVMRGEETQIFGALQWFGIDDARIVLPGTHSKWATVVGRRITDFSTWMTGEFYALLRQHSILARTLPEGDSAYDGAAFDAGVQQALQGPGLLHTAFSARTLSLFGRMAPDALPSYLSGLVIGEELKSQSVQAGDTLIVVGADTLSAHYEQALALLGARVRRVGPAAGWLGLRAVADTLT